MTPSTRNKWLKFALRWGIAVLGIGYVIGNISLHDRVLFLNAHNVPVEARLATPAVETITPSTEFQVINPETNQVEVMPRSRLVNRADQKHVILKDGRTVELLASDLANEASANDARVARLLIKDPVTGEGRWIGRRDVVPEYQLKVPYPLVNRGLGPMVARANGAYLWGAVLVFWVVYVITAFRWHRLLRAVGIYVPLARVFVLNMVGAFYNTFMPGSTGGDLLKAYYTAKQTPHKARAIMTVVVDRVLGLLALVVLGGAMAGYEYFVLDPSDPARPWCGRVAIGSLLIIVGTIVAVKIAFQPFLRRALGLEFLLSKLPAQKHITHAIETMRIYRQRKGLIIWAVLITLPVHATTVVSATFAGKAFNLPMHAMYYWVVVPVVVLAGAVPISPQGAGVMEFFAILLTRREGVTISGAFALTMSIRVVQILWNLTGGIFVLRGGYHAPSDAEQRELESDESEPPNAAELTADFKASQPVPSPSGRALG